MHVAGRHRDPGCPFGTALANAAPHLFTLLLYPVMDPANSDFENKLRKVAIQRKMRMRPVTRGGMRMFGALFTRMATWRKRGLDPTGRMLGAFSGSTQPAACYRLH